MKFIHSTRLVCEKYQDWYLDFIPKCIILMQCWKFPQICQSETGNFLLIFLQFYVYDLSFKQWGPSTFWTEFQTLFWCCVLHLIHNQMQKSISPLIFSRDLFPLAKWHPHTQPFRLTFRIEKMSSSAEAAQQAALMWPSTPT